MINYSFDNSLYLNFYLAKKNINLFLRSTNCNYKFKYEMDFSHSESMTFRDNICEEKRVVLWKLPSSRVKLNLIDDPKTLVNNALILLYINNYDFLIFNFNTRDAIRLFCAACLVILRRYQRINRKRGFYYEVTIRELLERCCHNYVERKDVMGDMLSQSQRNTNRKTVTVGNISMPEKVSISKRKFTDEEIDFVRFLKSMNYSVSEIMEAFKDRYGKTISRGKVSSIK